MLKQGSKILHTLRSEGKRARLKFWRMLLEITDRGEHVCPFFESPVNDAVYFGVMPHYMRGAFLRAYHLRTEARRGEAEIFEEAISELLQEHFRKVQVTSLEKLQKEVKRFQLGKDWGVYAILNK